MLGQGSGREYRYKGGSVMTRPYDVEKDQGNIPVPQIETDAGTSTMPWKGRDNAGYVDIKEPIERVTEALKQIDTDHAYIHEGLFYEAFLQFTLATTDTKYISLETPDTLYIHYRNEKVVSSADKVTVELFEDAVLNATPGGTALTPYNHNRLTTHTSGMTVIDAPTVDTEGTKIAQSFIGGGTGVGGARQGDDTSQANEWVLKRDTTYLIKITNDSTVDNTIQVNPVWYEEETA